MDHGKASAKFGVSALTISNWRKKKGGAVTKATAVVGKAGGDPWKQMVALKKDIDILEGQLSAKKAQFSKFAASL